MIPRRAFLRALGIGLLLTDRSARAQTPAKIPRVGWLGGGGTARELNFKAIAEGLRGLGYVIGQNVLLDARAPQSGDREQFRDLAARLVADGVEVILAANPYSLEAVTATTKTIPVVGVDLESDPVAKGWVASLARPGGNLTGFFLDIPEMSGKQLQFLKEVKPNLARVAVLGDPRVNELQFRATEAAARSAKITLRSIPIKSANEIQGAIVEAVQQRAGALVVLTSPLVSYNVGHISDAAIKHRLPAISPFVPAFAEAGGLLAYGPDFPDLFRRAGGYVARILKGAKPADLPVQRPTKFELVVNLKTARLRKLTLPQSLVLRADRVIGE